MEFKEILIFQRRLLDTNGTSCLSNQKTLLAHVYSRRGRRAGRHTPNIVVFVKTAPMGTAAPQQPCQSLPLNPVPPPSPRLVLLSPAAIFVPLFIHVGHQNGQPREGGFRRSKLAREEKRIFHEGKKIGTSGKEGLSNEEATGEKLHSKSCSL